MDAIESDGSLEAYLQASILFREFNEFGAIWHGCSWSTGRFFWLIRGVEKGIHMAGKYQR